MPGTVDNQKHHPGSEDDAADNDACDGAPRQDGAGAGGLGRHCDRNDNNTKGRRNVVTLQADGECGSRVLV